MEKTRPLEHTVAAVTGASSGIGEATALALAERGASIALIARREDRLREVAERVRAHGVRAEIVAADIADPTQAHAAVERAAAAFGRLDVFVNNAGLMLLGDIVGADFEEWRRMLDVNLAALMRCTLAALPHLKKAAESDPRRVADIVNVSSVAGRVARAGSGAYNATKFAVNAFSESLRQEVTKSHVRVALVEPGAVDTELAGHNSPQVQERMKQRFGDMERLEAVDIADAVVYVVTRPRRVAINELLVRPTEQEG